MADDGQVEKALRRRRAFESRRAREFYSYYHPILALSSKPTSLCDLHDARSVAEHQPASSPDKALTAFTQLAALRLGTRRSMLFFFDEEYAYILAEATRTLSLQDDDLHAQDDALWLGNTKIPRGFSVCEVTADLPVNIDKMDPADIPVSHIINDLRGDVRFCDRPFVTGGPFARFYAGVPITTPHGINIGALCVLDDKPRDGLCNDDVRFLRDMAAATMEHLEMVRAKSENERSQSMIAGLTAFMESRRSAIDPTPFSEALPAIPEVASPATTPGLSQGGLANPMDQTAQQTSLNQRSDCQRASGIDSHDFAPTAAAHQNAAATATQREDHFTSGVHDTLHRAAGLVLDSLSVDGVVLLDAQVGSYGGLVSGTQGLPDHSTETSEHEAKVPARGIKFDTPTFPTIVPDRSCHVLAAAHGPQSPRETLRYSEMPERLLRSLLRRYPLGHIWNFDKAGNTSASHLHDSGVSSATSGTSSIESEQDDVAERTSRSRRTRRLQRAHTKDGGAIQRLFPGVRSFAIIGMWDSQKEAWFAGLATWSFEHTRLLSEATELPFLNAFGEVILAEVLRMESLMVDRSKNDFVASISHELRSPLHGILGCVEALQEKQYDNFTRDMISSIFASGAKLAEIINGLLDFSAIDDASNHAPLTAGLGSQSSRSSSRRHKAASLLAQDSSVALDTLTEEIVEKACTAHSAVHRALQASRTEDASTGDHAVTITLNIDRSKKWLFSVASGAWRKMCTNLLSNALKFTNSGFITVSLSQHKVTSATDQECITMVKLTVEDSGVGISKAFQLQGLFKAFRQEDSLVEGTGLGLNLAAKVVEAQGGTIHLLSQKGIGTEVTVHLPMDAATGGPAPATNCSESRELKGTTLGLVGFGEHFERQRRGSTVEGHGRLLSSLEDSASHLEISTCVTDGTDAADIYMCSEQHLLSANHDVSSWTGNIDRPLIVLCHSKSSAEDLVSSHRYEQIEVDVHCLWQPIYPTKLAKAAAACRTRASDRHRSQRVSPALELPLSLPRSASDPSQLLDAPASSAATLKMGTPAGVRPSLARRGSSNSAIIPKKDQTSGPCVLLSNNKASPRSAPRRLKTESTAQIIELADESSTPHDAHITVLPRNDSVCQTQSAPLPLSLMLVDDNNINLQLLVAFAKKSRHHYTLAHNGLEAAEAYQDFLSGGSSSSDSSSSPSFHVVGDHIYPVPRRPQVILMDINMPIMDGFQATRKIRELERRHRVAEPSVIVALTGQASADARREAYASGMDMFLTKPVRLKELKKILDAVTPRTVENSDE